MGRIIEVRKANWDELVAKMVKRGAIQSVLEKILLKFGEKLGDWYVILCNGAYEEYNSHSNLSSAIQQIFPHTIPEDDICINDYLSDLMDLEESMVCNSGVDESLEQLEKDGIIKIHYTNWEITKIDILNEEKRGGISPN